jgi:hypothetical protein
MALTPTALIATTGLMQGQGLGLNSTQNNLIAQVNSDPLVGGASSLSALIASTPGAPSISLPSFLTTMATASSSIATQAQKMLPSAGTMLGNKNFLQMFSSAGSHAGIASQYSAAIAELGPKSFGDMGIGVSVFSGVTSGGLTSLFPSLAAGGFATLAAKAKTLSFGSLASVIPNDPSQAGSVLTGSLFSNLGSSLKNFGDVYDFTDLRTLGTPQGLVASIQNQGLADKYGINDYINSLGYDPHNLNKIPDSVFQAVLSSIQGEDLSNLITSLNVKPVSGANVTSLADLLNISTFIPSQLISALGLHPSASGLQGLGNSLTNLGVQGSNMDIGKMVSTVETKSLKHLDSLTELIPQSVQAALKPMLGNGSGPFGNPTMNDMMGSVAGQHSNDLNSMGDTISSLSGSAVGQSLATAMTALKAAISSGMGISTAATALNSAISGFTAQAASNSQLSGALSTLNTATSNIQTHLDLENSNLSLAGVNLDAADTTAVDTGGGVAPFLSLGMNLHSYGVDKNKVGHSNLFEGVATDDVTGDAIRASLAEGRNLVATSVLGKTSPAVPNPAATIAAAAKAEVPNLQSQLASAQAAYAIASGAANA